MQKVVRLIIDIFNVLLGIAAIVLTVMVFVNTEKNMWAFPIIFTVGATMNLITGIKHFMSDKKVSGIIAEVAAVLLGVFAFVCYRAIGG